MKALNWNSTVKVKLTELGKDIYYHRFDRLIDKGVNIERTFPRVDENGFSEFLLWSFIQLYGEHIGMAFPDVVDTINFFINDEDLDDVNEQGEYIRADQPQA